jgi:hypothetical protein
MKSSERHARAARDSFIMSCRRLRNAGCDRGWNLWEIVSEVSSSREVAQDRQRRPNVLVL